ncbi:MAG: amidohydrolase [Mariprofundaceae bacterium]|nr:amidohydrolase [Mariprofundaceae bacterium]
MQTETNLNTQLRSSVQSVMPDVIALRRHLHRHPELSGQEKETARHLASLLADTGLQIETDIGGHGLIARMDNGKKDWIVLRADMDALPIDDGKEHCDFASEVEHVSHSCGHDAHSAMLYGAVGVLSAMRPSLETNIAFIFQPAEETADGAASMVKDGVLEGMDVQRMHALHVYPYLPAGSIGLRNGAMCAAADMFDVEIKGHGGHAARPHECTDVILISSHIIQALHHIVSRRVDPLNPAVLTIGQIHAGSAANVIPDVARFSGTVRSLHPDTHEEIRSRMDRIIRQTAETWGATAYFHMRQAIPVLINDAGAMQASRRHLQHYLPDTVLVDIEQASMGGEDFAEFLQYVPGCLLRLGTGGGPATRYPLHHPCFDIEESAMTSGVATLAALCLPLSESN